MNSNSVLVIVNSALRIVVNSEFSTKSEERINEYELSENIDIYYISNSNIECIGLQAFAPNWYRDIKSKKDIEKIVQRLEDISPISSKN